MSTILELEGVTKDFGGLRAVDDVSLQVEEGLILGLIGPNGAGKSTLLSMVAGLHPATAGRIVFSGRDVTTWPMWKRARAGLARTFQSNRLMPARTVAEHIEIALLARENPAVGAALRGSFSPRSDPTAAVARALEPFGLEEVMSDLAEDLPHGHQRLLGIAMSITACATRPALLLLDEPVTGMNDVETGFSLDVIRGMRDDGFSIILVEHNMRALMQLVDRVFVMDLGRRLFEGTPSEAVANTQVIDVYLGTDTEGRER